MSNTKISLNKNGDNGMPLFRKAKSVFYDIENKTVKIIYEDVEEAPAGNDLEAYAKEGFQIISGEDGDIKYSTIREEFNLDYVDQKVMGLISNSQL